MTALLDARAITASMPANTGTVRVLDGIKAVAHTIKTYSKFTIPYPYPVAQSLEASNGMEYPMICFNFGRCEKDGTYS